MVSSCLSVLSYQNVTLCIWCFRPRLMQAVRIWWKNNTFANTVGPCFKSLGTCKWTQIILLFETCSARETPIATLAIELIHLDEARFIGALKLNCLQRCWSNGWQHLVQWAFLDPCEQAIFWASCFFFADVEQQELKNQKEVPPYWCTAAEEPKQWLPWDWQKRFHERCI